MNMKKFLAVLIFGLAMFAVSCSDESQFKNTAGGNTYVDSYGYIYTFSADAATLTVTVAGEGSVVFTFVSASSATSAMYSSTTNGVITITISGSTIIVV